MAYIDLTAITDVDATDIIDNDPALAAKALANAERNTRKVAQQKGVISSDIPLDGSNYLQSESLYEYCELRFLYHLFSGVTGVVDREDEYSIKAEKADHKSAIEADELTYYIITEEEVTQKEKRSTGFVIE